jgi:hypothetical protein
MRDPPHDENQIDGPVAEHLVCDVHAAAPRVMDAYRGAVGPVVQIRRWRPFKSISERSLADGIRTRRGGNLADRGDESVSTPVSGLDEPWRVHVVSQHLPNLAHVDFQYAIGDEHVRPERVEQLLLAHQTTRMCDQVPEERQRLRLQRYQAGRPVEVARPGIEAELAECKSVI